MTSMNTTGAGGAYFIGWDVGGWNCDRNKVSRDAIVILGGGKEIVGNPWRGNLKSVINDSKTGPKWIDELFSLCGAWYDEDPLSITLAIDAPLGFSAEFLALASDLKPVSAVGDFETNAYLFRETERHLFRKGLRPLSAIQDMIGSQATKARHVLAKYANKVEVCGVWTDSRLIRVVEAYPAASKQSALMQELRESYGPLGHADKDDALVCALTAYLFAEQPARLIGPDTTIPECEGWIWLPHDSFVRLSA
jgi:predicted nuclease with RNAse H fold